MLGRNYARNEQTHKLHVNRWLSLALIHGYILHGEWHEVAEERHHITSTLSGDHPVFERVPTFAWKTSNRSLSTVSGHSSFFDRCDYPVHSVVPLQPPQPQNPSPAHFPLLKTPTPQNAPQHPPPHLPHPPHPLLPSPLPLPHLLTPLHLPRIPIHTTPLAPTPPHKIALLPPTRRTLRARHGRDPVTVRAVHARHLRRGASEQTGDFEAGLREEIGGEERRAGGRC